MEVTKSLYGLTQDILQKLIYIDETDEQQLAELETELLVKVDNVASFIEYLEDQVELARSKERKIQEIKNTLQAKLDWLEGYVIRTLDHAKKDAAIGNNKEIRVKLNPFSVQVLEASDIPSEFIDLKQELVINKKKILESFKENGEIPKGTNVTRKKSLKIKEILK